MNEDPLISHLKKLEEKLMLPEIRKSFYELNEIIADEFVEQGASGNTYTKSQVIEKLKQEPPFDISIFDFNYISMSIDMVMLTYSARKTDKLKNETTVSLRSSVWKNFGNRWQIIFHQGTPLPADHFNI